MAYKLSLNWILPALLLAGGGILPGQPASPPPSPSTNLSPAEANRLLGVRQTGPETFEIGRISLDKRTRTLRFPARINMDHFLIEYALVTTGGKTHESLLVTDIKAKDLHLAALLLGIEPSGWPNAAENPLPLPAAATVRVEVEWPGPGRPVRHPLSRLIGLAEAGSQTITTNLADGPWLYSGWPRVTVSAKTPGGEEVQQNRYAGMTEGSLISLIADPDALVNNPRMDRTNDDIHLPNQPLLPPVGQTVEVIFQLPAPKKNRP